MNDLIFQAAIGPEFHDMLAATWLQHSAYAQRHGFDFWALDGWHGGAIGWARLRVMRQAFDLGYEFVVYLDADAVIVDTAVDLRAALPADAHLGAIYYDYRDVPGGQPDHWQIGVLYARNTSMTRAFLDTILQHEPAPYLPLPVWWQDPGSEQRVFNALAPEWMTRLDYRWNVIAGYEHGVEPVVLHLAGPRPGRAEQLRRYCRQE